MSLLTVTDLTVGHRRVARFGRGELVPVVHGVDLCIEPGEVLGLVGESGCGKSTLARTIVALHDPVAGCVRYEGTDVHHLSGAEQRAHRRRVQMIFQDPFLSLSPRQSVRRAIGEPLEIHGIGDRRRRGTRVQELLELVGLSPDVATRMPRDLSGGERQRVAVARALALDPRLLICDEPVTALDVSIQAKILNLLRDLSDQLGLACLFIAHDLAVVSQLADRVAVMHLGRIVEVAPTTRLFDHPQHPYTQALMAAIPALEAGRRPAAFLSGEPPSPVAPPSGCSFHPRCPRPDAVCAATRPPLEAATDRGGGDHLAACHFPGPAPAPVALTERTHR